MACQLDYLGELPTDRERRNALSKLPPTLPATYERILTKVHQSGEEVRRLVSKTLLLIRASLLQVVYLREALAIRDDSTSLTGEDMVDEYEIMLWCGSLVRKSTHGDRLEFSHFTVQEYLEGIDPTHATLNFYRVSYSSAHNFRAQTCLRYLMLENFEKKPQADMQQVQHIQARKETNDFYVSCTTSWVWSVRDQLIKDDTQIDPATSDLIQRLFDTQKSTCFYQWVFSFVDEVGEKYSLAKAMASIIRPDFAPLHMASALGLDNICDYLLKHGARVNLKSRPGSPLDCALFGLRILLSDHDMLLSTRMNPHPILQTQTVRLLLAAGASATPHLSRPSRQIAFVESMTLSLHIILTLILDLLRAGFVFGEEDLASMQRRLRSEWVVRKDIDIDEGGSAIFTNLLKYLKDIDGGNESSAKYLYSIIFEFAVKIGCNLIDLMPQDIQEEIANEVISSMIDNNDVIALEKIMDQTQADTFKNARFVVDGEDWTAIHLACDSSSSGVLRLLLGAGLDPEATTNQGTKPIHLCRTEEDGGETFKVFLQHHISTTTRNDEGDTIWHLTIHRRDIKALKLLINFASDKEEALQVISFSGQTAICLALAKQNKEAVMLLLEHCISESFWKSNLPLYRQAARLGSLKVVEKLLSLGLPLDEFDDKFGSPLHHISPRASAKCVEVLIATFSSCYRERSDGWIPFQSVLWRAIKQNIDLKPLILNALLPAFSTSQSEEFVQIMVDISEFFYSSVIKYIAESGEKVTWPKAILNRMIDIGLMSYIEGKSGISSLVLFATELDLSALPPSWLDMRLGQISTDGPVVLQCLGNWECISSMLLKVESTTTFRDNVATNHSVIRLLFYAIANNDCELVERLLQIGVDVHQRVDSMSALEIACRIPAVARFEDTIRCLLSYARADRINEPNDRLQGYTITHLVGIFNSSQQVFACRRLEQILRAGANANAVSSGPQSIPALPFHIRKGNITMAELLLQYGADPWLTGWDGCNAALAAIEQNNTSLLRTIARYSTSRNYAAKWDQKFRVVRGGNAFHVAAMYGSTDCIQLYLDEKWLSDLESVGAFQSNYAWLQLIPHILSVAMLFHTCLGLVLCLYSLT